MPTISQLIVELKRRNDDDTIIKFKGIKKSETIVLEANFTEYELSPIEVRAFANALHDLADFVD